MQPVARVIEHELADPVGPRAIVVDRRAPGRVVALGEILWCEVTQVVAVGPEMVVDHVENHREATPMCRVDEALQGRRPAVDMRWREEVDAVIAPITLSGEFGDRQGLDRGDAECGEPRKLPDQTVKCS